MKEILENFNFDRIAAHGFRKSLRQPSGSGGLKDKLCAKNSIDN
jgi:hypothetical protein